MKRLAVLSWFLCATLFAQAPSSSNKPVTGDASYNILPTRINGNPPNLPAGSLIDGVPIGTGGGGSVTSFSSGNLSPLFTTSVVNATTTPALSFTLSTAGAHTFFANNTSSTAGPSFTSFVAGTDYWDTTVFTGAPTIGLVPSPNGVPTCLRFLDENGVWSCASGGSSGGAPDDAHYLTDRAESGLTAEVNLGALTTGLLKGTVSAGQSTISSITDNSSSWDTAFSERRQWDGGSTNLVAATGRTSLGGTTVGQNFFTLTNPSAITFPKIAADNSVSAESASTHRTSIGGTTVGQNFFTLTNPSAITFPKIAADNSVSAESASTHRTSIGATTVGGNLFTLTNPSAVTWPRINADNTITTRSASQTLSDLGGLDSTSISDTAYGSGWNAVTTVAPSKNAVYDWGHTFDTDDDGKVNVLDMGAGIVKTDSNGVVSAATGGTDYADNAFKTWAVSGQSNVVADSAADTITYVAGSNMTITTDASTDTITFAASGGGGTTSKVTGSNFTETSGTMTDITGLTFAATTGHVYEIDVLLKVQHTSTNGMKFEIYYGGGSGTGNVLMYGTGAVNNISGVVEGVPFATSSNNSYCTSANQDCTIFMKAIYTTTSSNNITVQVQRLGVAQTATVYIGSRMTVTLLN